MQVLIEETKTGYRATSSAPLSEVAEGETREDALNQLRNLLNQRLRNGTQLLDLRLTMQAEQNVWLAIAGVFKDDPDFDAWQEAIRDYRRLQNEAETEW